jgi:Domain of unknown function (DUF5658)
MERGEMAGNASDALAATDRRASSERREQILRAVLQGHMWQRRRGPRRGGAAQLGAIDWHEPQWLAAALLIMLLSIADAVLTLTLLNHGAVEVNPFMRLLLVGGDRSFVFLKLLITAITVTMLVLLLRVRAFGRQLAGPMLLLTALCYSALVGYEYWLLGNVTH